MKKLTFILILGIFPVGAFAERFGQSTCASETEVPKGYCCIEYIDNDNLEEHFWNCDNLDLNSSNMEACKTEQFHCTDYCRTYDLDNDTCTDRLSTTHHASYSEDCTIPHAAHCSYTLICDGYDKNCYREDEEVDDCDGDNYYMTEDWMQCLKCPSNGVVDGDVGNNGIATCYIPRGTMTGSDATGTFKYVNDKCYYKE